MGTRSKDTIYTNRTHAWDRCLGEVPSRFGVSKLLVVNQFQSPPGLEIPQRVACNLLFEQAGKGDMISIRPRPSFPGEADPDKFGRNI